MCIAVRVPFALIHQDIKEYLNQSGTQKSEFSGSQKRGDKGEVRRGEVVGEWTGTEGERGGKMREKGWGERGPKAHSKNSDFGTPMIRYSLVAFRIVVRRG